MTHVIQSPLEANRPLAFSVIRVPFFLEPHYSETKVFEKTNRERLIEKWGGVEGWERQKRSHNLKQRGMDAGIPHFNLDRLASNTMASHRLIQHLGKTYGLAVSEAVYDRLNQYYFVEGHSLNDRPLLAKVVVEELEKLVDKDVCPTEETIFDFLNSNQGRMEIENALYELQRLGVHGIPKFIIEGRTVVDGAAQSDVFIQVFRRIERRGEVHGGPIFGDILGISDDTVKRASHTSKTIAA